MVPVKITHHKNKTKKCKCGKETFGEVEGNNGSEREVFFFLKKKSEGESKQNTLRTWIKLSKNNFNQ